jgi:CRISPR-associated endonuclease Csn1
VNKILGLDLGTNSIGWAIRDINEPGNQIIDYGVLTFEKGVGDGKSGEFPLVKKRTESRRKRRNYQAEKYRKWELLESLIANDLCPLSIEGLNQWKKYKKGTGRKYPEEKEFINWLRYDFNGDGKPDFEELGFSIHESHYLFRMLAVSPNKNHKAIFKHNPHILGRVFYHMVQRRGFRGRDEEESKTIMQGSKELNTFGADTIQPYIKKHKTLGAALYYLNKDDNQRIRKRYNLRTDYETELKEICLVQDINEILAKKLWKSIIWQRALRSQKGLVGFCTLQRPLKDEKNNYIKAGKKRCPISHPFYEEYRTWVFINNLKIKLPETIKRETYIEENIYPLFHRSSKDFKLSSIINELKKVGGYLSSNFAKEPETKIISCNLLYDFEKLLGYNWKNRYGWFEALQNQNKKCPYSIEDIWHVLFSFNSQEKLKEFATRKLGIEETLAEYFAKIKLQQGYATLSLSAIKKLLPYLRKGFIYSEAVYLANLNQVLGVDHLTENDTIYFSEAFKSVNLKHKEDSLIKTIVNSLISDQLNNDIRFGMDKEYQLDRSDFIDIRDKIISVIGPTTWKQNEATYQDEIEYKVTQYYKEFLQKPINARKDKLFLKSLRLHDMLFDSLQKKYAIPDKNILYLWHPSEQETYDNANQIQQIRHLGNPQPISRGFKNPMALKTMYKLKELINYLIDTKKVDEDTRIVIEIARELNDANMRKAIETWQRERESENQIFKKKINEDCGIPLSSINKVMIDKYRLWIEQGRYCLYTGKLINCSELFSSDARYDFEHTIPASMSFDNELKNLTVADAFYNKQIKGKKIPTELPNYEVHSSGYSAILPRLDFMFEKVEQLEKLLAEWKNKSKYASTKEIKDACIQKKHVIKFNLDYWRKKLETFTCKEYKPSWRNSQLRDTQIVTKYTLPYLKTVFNKVDVQKGSVTNAFKEIYKIKLWGEEKNRTKHSHHAIDAATLTLIPPAALRDQILKKYNEIKDDNPTGTYHEQVRNWDQFQPNYLIAIEDNVLINFQSQYRALVPTFKNVRKRGIRQFVKEKTTDGRTHYKLDNSGNKIPLIATGDTIRGQLHKETFFAAIKQPVYEEYKGKFKPKTDGEGNFIFQLNEKRSDNIFFVAKIKLSAIEKIDDFDLLVDPNLGAYLKKEVQRRLSEGRQFADSLQDIYAFGKKVDKNGHAIHPIRHLRCKIKGGGGGFITNPAIIKEIDSFRSNKEYKQNIYALNAETLVCAFYHSQINHEAIKVIEPYSILEIAKTNAKSLDDAVPMNVEVSIKKEKHLIPLHAVLKVKQKVIFFEKNIEELKHLNISQLSRRLYLIIKFEEGRISFKHHLNSMSEDALKGEMKKLGLTDVGASSFHFDSHIPIPKLRLTKANFNFAIENKHFEIHPDGQLKWL